jgi:hypothetical protein
LPPSERQDSAKKSKRTHKSTHSIHSLKALTYSSLPHRNITPSSHTPFQTLPCLKIASFASRNYAHRLPP